MKIVELQNDVYIKDWFNLIEAKEHTKQNFLESMKQYTDLLGKSPTEIITEAQYDIENVKQIKDRRIYTDLMKFKEYLAKREVAPTTAKTRLNAIKSFFTAENIEVPFIGKQKRLGCLPCHKQIPKREDIQKILVSADELERAIILVGVSSGLAENEITNIKISDFKRGYDAATETTALELRREKVEWDFCTFLTPEASRAVFDYLAWRNRTETSKLPTKINKSIKQKVYSDDGWLFIKRCIPDAYLYRDRLPEEEQADWKPHDEKYRKLTCDAIETIYKERAKAAGLNYAGGKGRFGLIRSHNMRKYFNSALLNANCDSFQTEYWLGHKLDETRSAYFRASVEKQREIYRKYIPDLTIAKYVDVISSKEYKEAIAEKEVWKATALASQVERYEFEEMKKIVNDKIQGDCADWL